MATKKPVAKKPTVKKPLKAKTLPLKTTQKPLYTISIVPDSFTIEQLPENVKKKVLNRAKRHFNGENIRHRVVSKSENSISFKFNRISNRYPQLPHGCVITISKVAE